MPRKNKPAGNEGTVLLVDDEKAVRESLGELLTTCGFNVLLADSCKNAVKALKEKDGIEVIICDLRMPRESGLEVLRYINKEKKKIPLIFLTGYGMLESCQEAVRRGAFDYILKPIDNKDKIIFPLKHAVDKYRLEKKNEAMRIDILRMAEEHQKILESLLADIETKEKVHKRIFKILEKWEEIRGDAEHLERDL